MIRLDLTERDVELIKVALVSAIHACAGLPGVDNTSTDSLAKEYERTLRRVERGGD